jgi:predicted  nucleic acid-binding Zn-ribbon protein
LNQHEDLPPTITTESMLTYLHQRVAELERRNNTLEMMYADSQETLNRFRAEGMVVREAIEKVMHGKSLDETWQQALERAWAILNRVR